MSYIMYTLGSSPVIGWPWQARPDSTRYSRPNLDDPPMDHLTSQVKSNSAVCITVHQDEVYLSGPPSPSSSKQCIPGRHSQDLQRRHLEAFDSHLWTTVASRSCIALSRDQVWSIKRPCTCRGGASLCPGIVATPRCK